MALGPLSLFDVKRGQEVGQNLAVSNPIGILAKNVMGQMSKMQNIGVEESLENRGAEKTVERIFQEEDARQRARSPFRRPVKIPSGQSTTLMEGFDAVRKMRDLRKMINENPDIETGPGNFAFHRQGPTAFLGNLSNQYMTDPDKARRVTDMSMLSNQLQDEYRRVVTGAQAGFPEIRFLQTAMPSTERQTRLNLLQGLDLTEKETVAKLDEMISVLEASGYATDDLRMKQAELMGQLDESVSDFEELP